MQIYLKRIEWGEEECNPLTPNFLFIEGKHPISEVWVDWNRRIPAANRLYNTYIRDEYLDSYSSLESAKQACQDEVDRLVMSCIEIERGWMR